MGSDGLNEILAGVIKKVTRKDKYALLLCQQCWREVVGRVNSDHSFPERIEGQTLFVNVDSPVWVQSLEMLQKAIVNELNRRAKGQVVKRVFFRTGPVPRFRSNEAGRSPTPSRRGAEDPAQALSRLRERHRQLVQEDFDRGLNPCAVCGLPADRENLCPVCRVKVSQAAYQGAVQLLRNCPWTSDQEILGIYSELSPAAVRAARVEVMTSLRRTMERMDPGGNVWKEAALALVMLKTGLPPDRVSPGSIIGILGREKAKFFESQEG